LKLDDKIKQLDMAITRFIQNGQPEQNEIPSPGIYIFKILTNTMAPVVVIAVLTILSVLVIVFNEFSAEMVMLILSVLPIVTGSYLKKIISRPRPNANEVKVWVKEKSYNFPSTHAAVSMSLYGFLAFISLWFYKPSYDSILAISMIALISFSRIYLGAHYPSDVFGGLLLGLINLAVLICGYIFIPHDILSKKIVWILLIVGWIFVIIFYNKYPDNIPDFLYKIPTLLSRIYTGTFILIITLGAAWLGGIAFRGLMWTLLIIALWEIFHVNVKKKKMEYLKFISAVTVTIFMNSIIELRDLDQGKFFTFLFIVAAAISDISGWAIGKSVGKFVGKRKIFPNISPNKTLTGTIAAIIIPSLAVGYFLRNVIHHSLMISMILSISAVAGDLIESWLKRKLEIKDFSNFLPGHGGILDRIDSQFFSGFILYILYTMHFIHFL